MNESIIDRVKKLMALAARGGTPEEAAAATARAQDLIDRYNLGVVTLDESVAPVAPVAPERAMLDNLGRVTRWRVNLASALARNNQCRIFIIKSNGIAIVGIPAHVQVVNYLYQTLINEIDRLAINVHGNGRVWLNNYRLGVVDTIVFKLREQKTATENSVRAEAAQKNALMVIDKAAQALRDADIAAARLADKFTGGSQWNAGNMRSDHNARSQGRTDGNLINVGGRSRGGLGTGQRKLGGTSA